MKHHIKRMGVLKKLIHPSAQQYGNEARMQIEFFCAKKQLCSAINFNDSSDISVKMIYNVILFLHQECLRFE